MLEEYECSQGNRQCVDSRPCPVHRVSLGDIVALGWEGYDTGTVCQVHKDGTVDVFRPYTHSADFSTGGSEEGSAAVICYIGTETVKHLNPSRLKILQKAGTIR